MKSSTLKKKILWAVDPFGGSRPLLRQTARSVAALASQLDAEVEPVYLLGDFPPNVLLLPALIQETQAQADDELRHLIKGIRIPGLQGLRLIPGPRSQMREQADRLIALAKKSGASLIAVGTRARKGPGRWLLGSFAETLIFRSDVPLFVVNPGESVSRRFDHVLFPTDFSDESKRAFARVIEFSRQIKARLTLFHKIKYDLTPAVEVAFSAYPAYKDVFEHEVDEKRAEADKWTRIAREAGVRVETVVDYNLGGSAADAILRRTRSRGAMIAMAGHSGPVASAILGSTTRQIVRNAKCPVWVIHTAQRKKGEEPLTFTEEDVMEDLTRHGRRRAT